MILSHLVYTSTARDADQSTLEEIGHQSSTRNEKADVTGALWFDGHRFLQILEGPEDAVAHIYERICQDQRHTDISLLKQGDIPRRLFPDWSMATLGVPGDPTRLDMAELLFASPDFDLYQADPVSLTHFLARQLKQG
ncbi:BLUF domain-containing protein [Yunchengibacter salinarum]|uniref:BLUF domain-containing protein n=1 Tax=Yunchengibacter salinarum TaxID=3133399 RepID=UPI0035B66844